MAAEQRCLVLQHHIASDDVERGALAGSEGGVGDDGVSARHVNSVAVSAEGAVGNGNTLESLEVTVCDHGATIADDQCRHRLLVFLQKATTGGASITKLAVGNLERCKSLNIDVRSDLEAFDVNGGGAIVDFEHAREGGSGARHQPDLARSGLGTPVARDVVSATDKNRERSSSGSTTRSIIGGGGDGGGDGGGEGGGLGGGGDGGGGDGGGEGGGEGGGGE
eukprot:scaffold127375_cov69-Phaeocystis_antarctica.AAC.3